MLLAYECPYTWYLVPGTWYSYEYLVEISRWVMQRGYEYVEG